MNNLETSNKLSVKNRKSMYRRWIFFAGLGYNYETQQAPSVAYAMSKALRKIYTNDDDYIEAMENHYKYFNVTPQMGNIILGASLALEEKDGLKAKEAIQALKTSLMGPFSGVGDSVFWILFPTIMGSISGYMALQGNATGAVVWMAMYIALYWVKMKFFDLGYSSGTKLVSSLGAKINLFTDAISVMGLMVIGTLIATVIKIYTPLEFQTGKVSLPIQAEIFDKIMPALLPVCLTGLVYWLLSKKNLDPYANYSFDYSILSNRVSNRNIRSSKIKKLMEAYMKRHFVIATHSTFAKGLSEAIVFFAGETLDITSINAYVTNKPIDDEVEEVFEKLNSEDELVILTDIMSGSVNQKFTPFVTRPHTHLITGANLPVALALAMEPVQSYLTGERVQEIISEAKEQIIYMNERANSVLDEEDE